MTRAIRFRQRLITSLKSGLERVVTWMDRRVPENPRQLLFGADRGQRFAENPRQLFEYLAAHPDWRPFWVSRSRQVVREVNQSFPGRALWWLNPRALWVGLRSRFFVISHSRQDVLPAGLSLETKFINLTHGTPLKAMGRVAERRSTSHSGLRRFYRMAASSDFVAELWVKAYGIARDRVVTLGMPRNDLLFARDAATESQLAGFCGKIILYAPTFRDWQTRKEFLPVPGLDVPELVRLLEAENAYLLLRPHYFEVETAAATISAASSPRILQAGVDTYPDVNKLLPFVDILITDYSSIYFDYLLLDRPLIFAPWDLEIYRDKRGFMMDYDSHTPGPKVTTPELFLSALRDGLAGLDPYKDERSDARSLFHSHFDGKSCVRFASFIAEHAVTDH